MALRIASDRLKNFQNRMSDFSMGEVPVDMYGHRVFPEKSDPGNCENAASDIRDYYNMKGDMGLDCDNDTDANEGPENTANGIPGETAVKGVPGKNDK